MEKKNNTTLSIYVAANRNGHTAEAGMVTAVEYDGRIAVASRNDYEVGSLQFQVQQMDWALDLAVDSVAKLMESVGAPKVDGIDLYMRGYSWEDAGFIFDLLRDHAGMYVTATGKDFTDRPNIKLKPACPLVELVSAGDKELDRITADPDCEPEEAPAPNMGNQSSVPAPLPDVVMTDVETLRHAFHLHVVK